MTAFQNQIRSKSKGSGKLFWRVKTDKYNMDFGISEELILTDKLDVGKYVKRIFIGDYYNLYNKKLEYKKVKKIKEKYPNIEIFHKKKTYYQSLQHPIKIEQEVPVLDEHILFNKRDSDSILDKDKIRKGLKQKYQQDIGYYTQKIKDFKRKYTKKEIESDIGINNKEQLLKDIHKLIKIYSDLKNTFEDTPYVKCHGSFSDFFYRFDDLLDEFGFYPNRITGELINYLKRVYSEIGGCVSGWIDNSPERLKIYNKIKPQLMKVINGYLELNDEIEKYNL